MYLKYKYHKINMAMAFFEIYLLLYVLFMIIILIIILIYYYYKKRQLKILVAEPDRRSKIII
jgi:hypothetical protein